MQFKKTSRTIAWNTLSGLINAGQSAIILMFLAHYATVEAAGIFTISYALGNLFSTTGKYGVRNYQVTDFKKQFSFKDYLYIRIITCSASFLVMCLYFFIQSVTGRYTFEKTAVGIGICIWKMIDTIEDVYYGFYQQNNRLDLGAKCYSIRLIISTVFFCVLTYLRISLIPVTYIVLIISGLAAFLMISHTKNQFQMDGKTPDRATMLKILYICFPLFIGTSLAIYVGNFPRYLIDWFSSADDVQAVFGYIMMPTFVIMMVNQFVYQPFIRDLGILWVEKNRKKLITKVIIQSAVTMGITFFVVLGGVIVGIPLLSVFYNIDLQPYRAEFIMLLIGGGAYAIAHYLVVPITAIRAQKGVAPGYILISVLSIILGKHFIETEGILGASKLYIYLNILLAVYFAVVFFWMVRRDNNEISQT